ncbi:MAG: aquaporin [Rubricoccaceae bacterium]|nr:aquaporin [Rubricoccaceae bacterium]
MTRKLTTEFIGTFFLVFTIGLTVLIGTDFAPIAIGSILMVMVYMGGHISGAHYNPAVSLAVWMRGRMDAREFGPYVIAQLLAALLAAVLVYVINDRTLDVAPATSTTLFEFFLLELLFTFALALVILNVATAKSTEGNSYYGLAIGFTVLAGAYAAGPISGGAFNPAVAIGPIIVDAILGDSSSLANLWVYVFSTFGGGALAAVVFKLQNPEDK